MLLTTCIIIRLLISKKYIVLFNECLYVSSWCGTGGGEPPLQSINAKLILPNNVRQSSLMSIDAESVCSAGVSSGTKFRAKASNRLTGVFVKENQLLLTRLLLVSLTISIWPTVSKPHGQMSLFMVNYSTIEYFLLKSIARQTWQTWLFEH